MRSLIILVGIVVIASALPSIPEIDRYFSEGYEQIEDKFGALHLKRDMDTGSEHVIVWPKGGLFSEPDHRQSYYDSVIRAQKNPPNHTKILECKETNDPEYWKFLPHFVQYAVAGGPSVEYSAPCFKNNTVVANIIDNTTIELVHTAEDPFDIWCEDDYLFATSSNYHITAAWYRGEHKYTFKDLTPDQFQEFTEMGIAVFRFCDHLYNLLPDYLMTYETFLGGWSPNGTSPPYAPSSPVWQVDSDVAFIKEAIGYTWEPRPNNILYNLNTSLIQSGDFFAVYRMGGTPQIIQYGAGSYVGHSTVALWVDGELYICESQGGAYWPRQGIQMNPWADWVEWAWNASYMVTWLPLTDEYRARFNATAAYEWFTSGIEGLPYGYHNFVFGWVDTPYDNFPPVLSADAIAPVLAIFETVKPKFLNDGVNVFNSGINMRMNTTNLTIPQLAQVLWERNLTFPDAYAMVEQDDWVYYNGYSMVCSSFVVEMWKNGGMFGDIVVQGTEFTPRDIYQMNVINATYEVPLDCKAIDPVNPYCQIMGEFRMQFPGIATVSPYNNMDETCSGLPPNYPRPTGC